MPPRVLLLSTPLDAAADRNGTSRAVRELAIALAAAGHARPIVLVDGADAPPGCDAIEARRGAPLSILRAAVRARPDVIHAIFAPRVATALALRALRAATRAKVVQTIASRPRRWSLVRASLAGDVVVATSRACEAALLRAGVDRARVVRIAMPFSPPALPSPPDDAPSPLILYVGDYEFGDALDAALDAFEQLSAPRGLAPVLGIAARTKTPRARAIEASVRARVERSPSLRGRVRILGELPSLLPHILAATCVILPAKSTYAKLDHPRALLEAIALGTPIVVGPAPSLAELIHEGAVGCVAPDVASLREAIERSFESNEPYEPRAEAAARILASRAPARIAQEYGEIYARLTAGRTW